MARQTTLTQGHGPNPQAIVYNNTKANPGIRSVFLVWVVFAGLFYGLLIKKSKVGTEAKYFPTWTLYALLVLSILCLIASIQYLRADRAILKGDMYFQNKNYDIALSNYFQSLTYNSYNDVAWYKIWKVYFAMNRFELAKNSINRAITLERRNGVYWASLALSNKALDETVEYESNMENAKRYLSP